MAPKKAVKELTWPELNAKLLTITSESVCLKMLEAEKAGNRSSQKMLRIYGRYSALRSKRERAELFK